MRFEFQFVASKFPAVRITRIWPSPPRIGDLVRVQEHGCSYRVKDVWWGPFEEDPDVDVFITLGDSIP